MKSPDNLDYVPVALALGRTRRVVHNQELKDLVMAELDIDSMDGHWRDFNRPIKDTAIKHGHVFVPVKTHWFYDPGVGTLLDWIDETLGRHDAEVHRILRSIVLPRYRRKIPKRLTIKLIALRDALTEAIIAITDGDEEQEGEEGVG